MQEYQQRELKLIRKTQQFTGTWEARPEDIFPLLCPTREADWIPGWNCQLLYTESGYAEDKCVWRTNKNNSTGDGLWTFTAYKENEFIEFVKVNDDILMHAKISLKDNNDGTTSGTWEITQTALTKKGNQKIEKISEGSNGHAPIQFMIEHYLKEGETIPLTILMKKGTSIH